MAENITRCPQCQMSFRITDAHLKTAKGAVRCGSCLHVFNAREYLISPTDSHQNLDLGNHQSTDTSDKDTTDTDVLISDDMDRKNKSASLFEDDLREEFSDAIFGNDTGDFDFNLFERDTIKEDKDDVVSDDESWVLDLLENDDDVAPPPTEEELKALEEKHITAEFDASYYKNSFQIVDEKLPEEPSVSQPDPPNSSARDMFAEYDEIEIEEYDYSDTATFYRNSSSGSNPYIDAIEPEPVEFDWQRHSTLWGSKLFWGGLASLAAMIFIVQLAWIQFGSLSTIEPYRSYYASACKILSCTLPDLIDRNKIKTANLVVRSHPDVGGALIVDAVIQNTAKFEQTFPTLDLVFTDSQDKPVAARRLAPQQYLGGELAGYTHMPVKRPIHIAVEIADPGDQAIGYKISIAD